MNVWDEMFSPGFDRNCLDHIRPCHFFSSRLFGSDQLLAVWDSEGPKVLGKASNDSNKSHTECHATATNSGTECTITTKCLNPAEKTVHTACRKTANSGPWRTNTEYLRIENGHDFTKNKQQ